LILIDILLFILTLFFVFSFLAFVIGVIKPKVIIRWKENPNRKEVLKIFGITLIILFISIGVVGSMTDDNSKEKNNSENLESETSKIDVKLDIDHKVSEENKLKIIISSNLPEQTNFLVTIMNDKYDYKAQDSPVLENGFAKTSWFSDNGNSLKPGDYKVSITVPLAHTQPKSVQKIIGEKGDKLTGEHVNKDDELGKYADKETIIKIEDVYSEKEMMDYKIVSREDLSMKALGNKSLSDYTTNEIENLPLNKKISYNLVVGKNINSKKIKPFITNFINKKTNENKEIDELGVLIYSTEDRVNGAYDIARAIWSTDGEWGGITPNIARDNVRDNYEIFIDIRDNLDEYLNKISKEETKFNLSEKKRKEIYKELILCEDRAMIEADKHYSSMCSECSEFIEEDFGKRNEMENRLLKEYKKEVRNKYNITKEQQEEISMEGLNKNWPMPEMLPYPDCCD